MMRLDDLRRETRRATEEASCDFDDLLEDVDAE